ncbi:MAG: HIT family protein [Pseudohongiellaceae bacterium]|jgi:diadenosine tetraphosphate (Ap4A) HIT family hydrolase
MASIFTKILAGELPGHFIWKDAHCFSILTIQPIREGHLLVIPNAEVNHWDDVPPATAAHLMQVAQQIAKGIKDVIACKRVGVTVIGLEVPHTHLHLIPIDSMADMDFGRQHPEPAERLAATATKIRKALVAAGHTQADFD